MPIQEEVSTYWEYPIVYLCPGANGRCSRKYVPELRNSQGIEQEKIDLLSKLLIPELYQLGLSKVLGSPKGSSLQPGGPSGLMSLLEKQVEVLAGFK